jgi:hypothetical protein
MPFLSKECSAIPAKVIATCLALVSFAGAIFIGLAAGNSALVILGRALIVMLLAWAAGRLIGALAMYHVQLTIEKYKTEHPIPDHDALGSDAGGEATPAGGSVRG